MTHLWESESSPTKELNVRKLTCAYSHVIVFGQKYLKTEIILVPRGCYPLGQHQESWPLACPNFWTCAEYAFCNFQPIRFIRFEIQSVNCGLLVLGVVRGLDFWCWSEGLWSLETRMRQKCTTFTWLNTTHVHFRFVVLRMQCFFIEGGAR